MPCSRTEPSTGLIDRQSSRFLRMSTGEHPTTQLCLRYLASTDLQGKAVLDYGTGSGILGIAALKVGAASVIATDTQAQAVQAASINAELNEVSSNFQVGRARHRRQVLSTRNCCLIKSALLAACNELAAGLLETLLADSSSSAW